MTRGPAMTIPSLLPVLPEIVLLAAACVILILDLFLSESRETASYWLTQLTLLACASITVVTAGDEPVRAINGLVVDDMLSDLLKFFSYFAVSLMLFFSRDYLTTRGLFRGETFVLTLFTLLGMMVMISAANFLTLYLGLELQALSLYAMVAMHRDREARLRSGDEVLRAGRARLRNAALRDVDGLRRHRDRSTSTQIARRSWRRQGNRMILLFGLVFIVSAIAFKLGAAPYHMWVPDVYHGAPTAVTLLIGTRAQARRVRVHAAPARERPAGARVRLAGHADGALAAVDDPRQRDRDRADQHQADARVLDDRQHGLHAAGVPRGEPQRLTARRCSTSSPTC